MKVALIGASGNGGSRLVAELSRRGHEVTAIARDPGKIAVLPHVSAQKAMSSTSLVSSSCSRATTP
jgi:putative NADH-flavin reductase